MRWLVALVTAAVLPNEGSAQQKPKASPPRDQAVIDDIQDIRIKGLESRVEVSFARLDCNTGRFDTLMMETPKLLMFASCKNIETYLEGHRVTVEIGNPYSFFFSGVSGRVKYGKDYASKSVDLNYAGQLPPGKWTTVTVVINPSMPDEMRNLDLYLSASTVAPTR